MKNQNCKVGTVTQITNSRQTIHLLEYQYENFMNKASSITDEKLIEFFESKAQKVQKILATIA